MAELSELRVYSLDDLEAQLGEHRFPKFVEESEKAFQVQVERVVQDVLNHPSIKMIFISGPTSSGKTTTTNLLTDLLNKRGKSAKLLSLDDYYFEQPTEYDAEGRPDMESIDTIEVELLHHDLEILAQGGEIIMPLFDFTQRKRLLLPERRFSLGQDEVLLVEGLHALSEHVIRDFDPDNYLGIFLMPYAQFIHDKRTLEPEDIRKMRRISRDIHHRRSTALSTLDYWPAISREEENFIKPYLARADYYINTSLAYEFLVIAPAANKAIQDSLALYEAGELPPSDNVKEGIYYADLEASLADARRLAAVSDILPSIDSSVVPANSILQEFI